MIKVYPLILAYKYRYYLIEIDAKFFVAFNRKIIMKTEFINVKKQYTF